MRYSIISVIGQALRGNTGWQPVWRDAELKPAYLVCGDDEAAKASALELAAHLVTGRALDAGPLASARALEGMTAVIVNLNRRYSGHAGLEIVGL